MVQVIAQREKVMPGRFAYLMGLYAENYHRLARMFAPLELQPGVYFSSVDDGLDVRLDIVERHAYTLDMRLSYVMLDHLTGEPSPSAWLRVYRDAHVAEATHCQHDRHLRHVLGPLPPAKTLFQQRMRMATFLNRWLEYLAEQGHSRGTLCASAPPVSAHCA